MKFVGGSLSFFLSSRGNQLVQNFWAKGFQNKFGTFKAGIYVFLLNFNF